MQTTISWSRHLSSHTIDGKVARLKARVETRKIRLSLPTAAVAVDETPDEVEDVAVLVVDAVSVVVMDQIKVVVAELELVKRTTVLMVVTKVVLRSEAATTAMIKDIQYEAALFSGNAPLRKAKEDQRRSATRLVEKEKVPSPAIRLVMDMKVMITLTLPCVFVKMDKKVAHIARDRWYLDSGATNHLTNQRDDFVSSTPLSAMMQTDGENRLEVVGDVKKKLVTSTGRHSVFCEEYGMFLSCSTVCFRWEVNRHAH
ncbi:hypothetical protein PF008_g11756 [Phytophthora fragariae]|uniref:Retrovirus-related Pol polyprotein from transposon TNT 1-94-like beta-barrel domain-containing protein n=1 Tax=Phytophthora fragariae TaxID=53985 RepID=A0A6G0RPZ4_9STRA|nr:hypothetical protein PF008_g11756 [Phytophthora fragariae]